jgi:hypothetical protein
MPKAGVGLVVDRLSKALPNATIVYALHDVDIPEGYVVEIWGAEIAVNGLLDTGGHVMYFCTTDDDQLAFTDMQGSDDVFFCGEMETLLVTTGGAMILGVDRVMFPQHPVVTARDQIMWAIYSATNWSAATASLAIFYRYRKATAQDITELLLRRR